MRSLVPPALVLLVVGCAAQPAARSWSTTPPSPALRGGRATPAAIPTVTASPAIPVPQPPAFAATTFTGTIVHAPGARVRYGPSMDMPVLDIDPSGTIAT